MLRKIYNSLTGRLAMLVGLAIYAFALAMATFIESRQGAAVARAVVYNAWWFYILQALLVLNFIGMSVRFGVLGQRKYGILLLHYGFVVILVGAMVTHLWGIEGMMHIRQGETSGKIYSENIYLSLSVKQGDRVEYFKAPLRYSITGKGEVSGKFMIGDQYLEVTTVDFCTRCAMMGADRITLRLRYGDNETKAVVEGGRYRNSEPVLINQDDMSIALVFGSVEQQVPFSVTLDEFRLVRYPGSGSPSSFESDITVHREGTSTKHKVYMNNVVHVGGYRLYQSSYDGDEKGTVLTVNRDSAGTFITYTGYAMLFLGMILALFHRNSRFRTLIRSIGKNAAAAVVMCFITLNSFAQDMPPAGQPQGDSAIVQSEGELEVPTVIEREQSKRMAPDYAVRLAVSPESAKRFGSLMVQTVEGRIEPIDTYASKLLRKISRSDRFLGLNPDQVLLGITTQPYIWSRVPFIKVGDDALLARLGGGVGGYISFIDVLDDEGNYILADDVERIYAKPVSERNKYDKELLKIDEKINILNALFSGSMLAIFPHENDPDHKWYSPGDDLSVFEGRDSMFVSKIFSWYATELGEAAETGNWKPADDIVKMISTYQSAKSGKLVIDTKRIEAEILYNRLNVFKWAGFAYMGAGLLLLIILIANLLRNSKGLRIASYIFAGLIVAIFCYQTFGLGLRWYVSGRAPWTNAYESMVYVAWATALAGVLFVRRSRMTLALAAFFAGVILFVSNLNWMDPEITPLVPVLKSYWLIVHVAVITGSYGFFGIGFLLGFISLLMMALRNKRNEARLDGQIRELAAINEMALTIGLVLMTAGTFLGAIWANESWGRYWGWDPKETWALITVIVYAFIIHARFVPFFRGRFAFSVMSVVGFASVLMTFFGVNYYLSGLHSYGGDSAPPAINAIYAVYSAVLLVIILAAVRNKKQLK